MVERIKEIFVARRTELLLTSLTFILCIFLFDFVSDDYAYFMSSLATRQFSDFAYFDVHFQGFIGIREVYKLLYLLFPRINWHFAFMLLYEFVSLYLLLRLIRTVILRDVPHPYFIIAAQVLTAIYYSDSIISVSHTRVSIIFCGVALIRLILSHGLSRARMLLYGGLFISGMLLRPESGLGTLAIVLPGTFVLYGGLVHLVRRVWLPVLAMAAFLAVFTIDLHYTQIYSRRVEPEIEYKMMARRLMPLSAMHSPADSARRDAALTGMWFDMRVMSPEYMRSIILPGSDMSLAHMREVAAHLTEMFRFYSLLLWVGMLLWVGAVMRRTSPAGPLRFGVFLLYSVAIIYALDYNGLLVSHRHFMSLLLVAVLLGAAFVFRAVGMPPVPYGRTRLWGAIVLLYLLAIPLLSGYRHENRLLSDQVWAMEQTMARFEQRYTGRIVAITIDGRFLFDRHFSLINQVYQKNTYIMFDWFTFHLTPRYMDYLHRLCGCDSEDPVAFFRWLGDQQALYITEPYRYDLTSRYMRAVHGIGVSFQAPVRINDLSNIEEGVSGQLEVRTVSVSK